MGGGRKSNVEKPALNKRQEKILEILAGGKSLSANEIFDQLDDVASLRTVKADLAALKKLLLLEQIGRVEQRFGRADNESCRIVQNHAESCRVDA